MKRAWLWVLLAGCQQTSVTPSAQLTGLRDMVRVGEYIVATSTERDELRVLDLVTGDTSQPRKYVRAPNPIQPLAIPVLKRPTTLVTDLFYLGGTEIAGPYVYASSPGTAQISIVWAENQDPDHSYTEVARLATIAPVTAMAAEGGAPGVDVDGGVRPLPSRFYFATFDGSTTTLFRLEPKRPEEISTQNVQADARVVLTLTNETIIDMVALPGGRLAFATRGSRGSGGQQLVIDGMTGQLLVTLQFPAPVRAMYSHGAFALRRFVAPEVKLADGGTDPNGGLLPDGGFDADAGYFPDGGRIPDDEVIAPGARVYGVLDEATCGSSLCGGLVAVDTDTGLRSLSLPGRLLDPSTPRDQRVAPALTFGPGLIQSVSLAPGGSIFLPAHLTPTGVAEPRSLAMLGAVSLTNGQLVFFFAAELQQINTQANGPGVVIVTPDAGTASTTTVTLADGSSAAVGIDGGFSDFVGPTVLLAQGAAVRDNVLVTGFGVLPGLRDLPVPAAGNLLPTSFADRAQLGDTIDGCADGGVLTVVGVETTGVRYGGGCMADTLSVRAAGTAPYVVTSGVGGYMGRSRPGGVFEAQLPYLHHYADYVPSRPGLVIRFPAQTPLSRDDYYELSIDDGYLPFVTQLTATACNAGFTTLPGTIIDDPVQQRIFVAYPSANGIVELQPDKVRRTFSLETGYSCWR